VFTSKPKLEFAKDAAAGKRFALVVSRYHEEVTKELVAGATSRLQELGAKPGDILTLWVPGSFEIPLVARVIAQQQQADAIICLGVIVKGETTHDQIIAREAARGVGTVAQQFGIPVIFGILTTENLEQAKARAGGARGHKGIESAESAVAMLGVIEAIKKGSKKSTKSLGF
jgi:6,7-dimethyl-8-ribityllumazine synthase